MLWQTGNNFRCTLRQKTYKFEALLTPSHEAKCGAAREMDAAIGVHKNLQAHPDGTYTYDYEIERGSGLWIAFEDRSRPRFIFWIHGTMIPLGTYHHGSWIGYEDP